MAGRESIVEERVLSPLFIIVFAELLGRITK